MTLLRVRALGRSFGGVEALAGVDLEVDHGELVGIVGPNGSGKTTLFDCISGWTRPDHGEVRLDGVAITHRSPRRIARMGLARIFQTVRTFPTMTVLENVLVAGQWSSSSSPRRRGAELVVRSREHLEVLGLARLEETMAGDLSYGQQRLVEAAQVLVREPALVLLDEASAGIHLDTVEILAGALDRLRASGGAALVIEHEPNALTSLCDSTLELDRGRVVLGTRPSGGRPPYRQGVLP